RHRRDRGDGQLPGYDPSCRHCLLHAEVDETPPQAADVLGSDRGDAEPVLDDGDVGIGRNHWTTALAGDPVRLVESSKLRRQLGPDTVIGRSGFGPHWEWDRNREKHDHKKEWSRTYTHSSQLQS